MNRLLMFAVWMVALVVTIHAQVQPWLEVGSRVKLDFTEARMELVPLPYSNAKLMNEHRFEVGLRWERTGVSLETGLRLARHNARFSIKNNEIYVKGGKRDILDFELQGIHIPLAISLQKPFSEGGSIGIQGRIGLGATFVKNFEAMNEGNLSDEFLSTITGEERLFEWQTVVANYRSGISWQTEASIGCYFSIAKQLELSLNVFSTHSFIPLAFHRIWYYDQENFATELNMSVLGQSAGLEIGLRFMLEK